MAGIPRESGTIGFGVGVAIEVSYNILNSHNNLHKHLSDTTIAINGFENIGSAVVKYLKNKGSKIVAISDHWSMIYDKNGIDIDNVFKYSNTSNEKRSLKKFKPATKSPVEDIINVDCDILVSASGKNLLTEKTLPLLKAKYFVEEINDPITAATDQFLYKKGMFVLPNVLTDIGSVICSNAEYNRKTVEMAFSYMESKIEDVIKLVIQRSLETNTPVRRVAQEIAQEKILNARQKT
jgi:glutamate dehydrogenase/leucine dehydrogenase